MLVPCNLRIQVYYFTGRLYSVFFLFSQYTEFSILGWKGDDNKIIKIRNDVCNFIFTLAWGYRESVNSTHRLSLAEDDCWLIFADH